MRFDSVLDGVNILFLGLSCLWGAEALTPRPMTGFISTSPTLQVPVQLAVNRQEMTPGPGTQLARAQNSVSAVDSKQKQKLSIVINTGSQVVKRTERRAI